MFQAFASTGREICLDCDWRAFRDCQPGSVSGVVYELCLTHKCRTCDKDHAELGHASRVEVLVDHGLRTKLLHTVALTSKNGAKATQAHGLLVAAVADAVHAGKGAPDRHYLSAWAVTGYYTGAAVKLPIRWDAAFWRDRIPALIAWLVVRWLFVKLRPLPTTTRWSRVEIALKGAWIVFPAVLLFWTSKKNYPRSRDVRDHDGTSQVSLWKRAQKAVVEACTSGGGDPAPQPPTVETPYQPREGRLSETAAGELVVEEVATDSVGKVGGVSVVGPSARDATLHRDTPENVSEMIRVRIKEKRRVFAATPADRAEVGNIVNYLKRNVFNEANVKRVVGEIASFDEIKSKKWSRARFENAYDELLAMCALRKLPGLSVQIKQEVYKRGKAPRGVINEGEVNQLCALLVIYVMEVLLFEHFGRNIKHAPKKEKMAAVAKDLSEGAVRDCLGFGDFSAFDTTMTLDIRNLLENPLIEHVTNVLRHNGFTPDVALDHHLEMNGAKVLKLKCKDPTARKLGLRVAKFTIDSIRRSGHRGTSALNFLTNYVMCTLSYFPAEEAKKLFDGKNHAIDRWGLRRMFKLWCEGDDSIWRTGVRGGREADQKQMSADIEAFWIRFGFNMVSEEVPVGSGGRLEFCGYEFSNGVKFGEHHMPSIARALDKFGHSTSPQVGEAVDRGQIDKAASLMAHKYVALADCYAECAPSLALMFLNYCRADIKDDVLDGDASMVVTGDRDSGLKVPEVFKRIEESLVLDPHSEVKAFAALERPVDAEAYALFTTTEIDRNTPEAVFRALVPSAF